MIKSAEQVKMLRAFKMQKSYIKLFAELILGRAVEFFARIKNG